MGLNKKQIKELIGNPEEISADEVKKLASLIKDYPYFQTARLLYSKGLQNAESVDFDASLQLTATYAADRKKLYVLLYGENTETFVHSESVEVKPQEPVAEPVSPTNEEKTEPVSETPMEEEPVVQQVEEVQQVAEETKPESVPTETAAVEEPTVQQVEEVQQVTEGFAKEIKTEVEENVESAQSVEVKNSTEFSDEVDSFVVNEIVETTNQPEEKIDAVPVVDEPKQETVAAEPIAEVEKTAVPTVKPIFSEPIIKAVTEDAPKNESLAERILRECRERKEREANKQNEPVAQVSNPEKEEKQSLAEDELLDVSFDSAATQESGNDAQPEQAPLVFEMLDEELKVSNPVEKNEKHDWFERSGGWKNTESDFNLIDKFILENPKMPKFDAHLAENTEDLALECVPEQE